MMIQGMIVGSRGDCDKYSQHDYMSTARKHENVCTLQAHACAESWRNPLHTHVLKASKTPRTHALRANEPQRTHMH